MESFSMTPRDRASLERILECIEAIETYVARTGPGWPDDDMTVDAVAKRLEEIGEVAKRVTQQTLASMPAVDWRGIKGLREIIVHDYGDIDVELLLGVVRDDLPGLGIVASAMLTAS